MPGAARDLVQSRVRRNSLGGNHQCNEPAAPAATAAQGPVFATLGHPERSAQRNGWRIGERRGGGLRRR